MTHEHYKAPVSAKAKATEYALYTFNIGKNNYANKSTIDSLEILGRYINLLNSKLEIGLQWHTDLLNIRSESLGLVAVSDFASGAKLPALAIWEPLKTQVNALKTLQLLNNVPALLVMLRYTSSQYEATYQQLALYAEKNQIGYEAAIETLTFVKKGAETVIGAYNPYIGGVYTAGLKVITQAQELRYNLRDEIDWKGIAIELVIDELFSLAVDKIADGFIQHLKLPMVQQSLPFTLKDKVNNLLRMAPNTIKKTIVKGIINKSGNVISDCLKTVIQQYRNSPQEITWEMLSNTAAEQFGRQGMSKSVIEEILAVGMGK